MRRSQQVNTPAICIPALAVFALASVANAQSNWPQFRGADSTGVADRNQAAAAAVEYPITWSTTGNAKQNIRWSVDVPGRGWSSPIVWGNRIYLTTVMTDGPTEDPKRGLYFGGDRSSVPQTQHEWKVLCLDRATGDTVWTRTALEGIPMRPLHIKNSYASETPVTDGERIYAYFGNTGMACFDMQGKRQWTKTWPAKKTRYGWGMAASPVLHDGRLYVVNDNDEQSFLTCLDAKTGDEVWTIDRDEGSNWATPYIWKNKLRTEVITPGSGRTRAYDLDGKLLYQFGGASSITIATPYAIDGLLYVSSGYVGDRKRPLFAIKPGASGDITLGPQQTSSEFVAWCQKQAAPYNPSTIVYRDQLYVLLDRGLVMCFDAKTGAEVYGRKRLPNGRAFTASPWAANGRVYFLNEFGTTYVVKAGREFVLEATNELGDELAMATPATVDGQLFIRTDKRLFCIEKAK